MRMFATTVVVLLALASGGASSQQETVTVPTFGQITIYQPEGPPDQGPRLRVATVGTGHHFGGEDDRLVDVILGRR